MRPIFTTPLQIKPKPSTLLLRTLIREGIPIFIGVASLFLVKYRDVDRRGSEYIVHAPNHNRLIEASDVLGGLLMLFSFYVNRLLEWKWSSDPYRDSGLSHAMEDQRLSTILTETSFLFAL